MEKYIEPTDGRNRDAAIPGVMKTVSLISAAGTIIMIYLYRYFGLEVFFSLAVTFGTTAYHFCIRLLVGGCFSLFMRNRADYTRKWYQPRRWEKKCYRILKVKEWKNKMPAYDASTFSPKEHSWDEIAQAMCQAELVHETNVILSFLPLFAAIPIGSFWVFLITSLAAAAFDMIFVVMQRYNRPRVAAMAMRQQQRKRNVKVGECERENIKNE